MELEEPVGHHRIRGEDGADLLGRHPLPPEEPPRRPRPHRSRSFGVSIHPRPIANSKIPSGAPITVNSSRPPVTNRIEPNTTPLRLGSSGPTHGSSSRRSVCISDQLLSGERDEMPADRVTRGRSSIDLARGVTDGGSGSSLEKMERRSALEARVPDPFTDLRPLLFSIAYRMLGSASEAEDIVQEAFLRYHRETSAGVEAESPKSYLSAVTTRLCIDHLRSARVRRESYVGTWLPEPLLTDEESDVERHAETADSLSMGFLVLLESLSPVERAVFLL